MIVSMIMVKFRSITFIKLRTRCLTLRDRMGQFRPWYVTLLTLADVLLYLKVNAFHVLTAVLPITLLCKEHCQAPLG